MTYEKRFNFIGRHPGKSYLFLLTTEMNYKCIKKYIICIHYNYENGLSREITKVIQSEEPLDFFKIIEVLLSKNNRYAKYYGLVYV